MPDVIVIPNLDNAISRYQAGEPLEDICVDCGVSRGTLMRRMRDVGVRTRTHSEQSATRFARAEARRDARIDVARMIERYCAGETMLALTLELGVDRRYIERKLEAAGIQPRTLLQSVSLRYANMPREKRMAITEAAHAAKRGKPAEPRSLERRAITCEHTLQLSGRSDLLFAVWMAQRGIRFTLQKAIGIYNIDIAVHEPAVAVEVTGEWRKLPPSYSRSSDPVQRREYLLGQGWRLIEVIAKSAGPKSLREVAADEVVALLQQVRGDESPWGEYAVIWGDGKPAPEMRSDRNDRA